MRTAGDNPPPDDCCPAHSSHQGNSEYLIWAKAMQIVAKIRKARKIQHFALSGEKFEPEIQLDMHR
jgi:hypothetical protein